MKTTSTSLLWLILLLLFTSPSTNLFAQLPGQVLLNLNYENGTVTSGVQGIEGTGIANPPADAVYMVQPGASGLVGSYAIAHKIIGGDNNYFSDGNFRSESAALDNLKARFYPGDIHRYEFSVLLKDWASYLAEPPTETNLFQLKMSGGIAVPYMFRIVRDKIRIRYGGVNDVENSTFEYVNIIPYVNQWMHFRVDVAWSTTNTGYFKTYAKLPGMSDYQLVDDVENYRTFTGDPSANVGYMKWGLYVAPTGVSRVAYHDDIRIINLRAPYTTTGVIWGNGISDANPAYLDGPYTKDLNIYNRDFYAITDNKRDVYLHPFLKFTPSQGIEYAANTTPNTSNNIIGTPYSDFSRTTLQAAGSSDATASPSGRYLLGGWSNSISGTPTSINLNQYYEFKMEPNAGYGIRFTTLNFTVLRGATSDPNTFELRSSADGFANPIGNVSTITNSGAANTNAIAFDASAMPALNNVTVPITFRLYAYGATRTANNSLIGLNDFQFFGQILQGTLPIALNNLAASYTHDAIHVNWQTASEQNNDYFEILISKDGKKFISAKKINSKNGNSNVIQSYEADILKNELASLLAIPLLLGLVAINKPSKRKIFGWAFGMLLLFFVGLSCKKSDLELKNGDKVYIKLKQVDKDGTQVISEPVVVTITK